MKTYELTVNNKHRIELTHGIWTGRQKVFYDGRVVSEKKASLALTPHSFTVDEGAERVVYEVNFLAGNSYGYIVRRNGIIVGHKP